MKEYKRRAGQAREYVSSPSEAFWEHCPLRGECTLREKLLAKPAVLTSLIPHHWGRLGPHRRLLIQDNRTGKRIDRDIFRRNTMQQRKRTNNLDESNRLCWMKKKLLHKITYCVILFIWSSSSGKINRSKKQNGVKLGEERHTYTVGTQGGKLQGSGRGGPAARSRRVPRRRTCVKNMIKLYTLWTLQVSLLAGIRRAHILLF